MAGRKRKKEEDKCAYITFTAPPQFKKELDETIQSGEKSRFLREAIKKELKKYKRDNA